MTDTLTKTLVPETHELRLSDVDTGKVTIYTLTYSYGVQTCDVHQMIDGFFAGGEDLQNIRINAGNGACPIVTVEEVSPGEFEILVKPDHFGDQLLEYVLYTNENRQEVVENNVFLVDSFVPATH